MESDPELLASLVRTWFKDGSPLTGVTGSSQVLGELSPSDSGTYECKVSTSVDSASVQHTLSVFRRTRLLQGPAPSPRMVSGNPLKLVCEVEVDPSLRSSLNVVWGRGEEELGQGVEEWGADSSLTTTWETIADVGDSGDYWCATTTRLEDRQVAKVATVEVLPASFTTLSQGLTTEVTFVLQKDFPPPRLLLGIALLFNVEPSHLRHLNCRRLFGTGMDNLFLLQG